MRGQPHTEVELLFSNLPLIALALAAVGILIVISGRGRQQPNAESTMPIKEALSVRQSAWIGAVQGLCLPFRGFSRSGATISTGLILGVSWFAAERFSFALAVVLTPPVILQRASTSDQSRAERQFVSFCHRRNDWQLRRRVVGVTLAHPILERGRWHWFGYYCLVAALMVFTISRHISNSWTG